MAAFNTGKSHASQGWRAAAINLMSGKEGPLGAAHISAVERRAADGADIRDNLIHVTFWRIARGKRLSFIWRHGAVSEQRTAMHPPCR
ncbi:hypothetical protein [Pseudolabrys taiwanensis]|nr:hypothetical protein [Pseudolabrys taiwanensis]